MNEEPTTPLDVLASARVYETDARALPPGAILAARYRIVSLLGEGGMGAVYRADDLRLGLPVALKFIARSDSIEDIYHEVRIARRISHPNVCRVHDVVEVDDLRFIAMEYVDGEDLASLLRRIGRLPAQKAMDIARDVCSGLAAAHDQGIIHRDLKPANVMLDGNGRAHITDFGLASLADRAHDGVIAGTPAYMAPEQVAGEPVTLRSDVYALGLLLYEIFTGERVHGADSFAKRRSEPAPRIEPPSAFSKEIDPAVERIILQCLAADPAARPADARAVLHQLPGGNLIAAAIAAGETPSPEMIAAEGKSGELSVAVAAACLVVYLIGLVALARWSSTRLYSVARKSPDVLLERATGIITTAGLAAPKRDSAYWFTSDEGLVESRWRSRAAAMRPGVVRFHYRVAPIELAAHRIVKPPDALFLYQTGRVDEDDPPITVPGMTNVTVDQNGALVELRAVPAARSNEPYDWRPLLAATGIDLATLASAAPAAVPPVGSDARLAWTATYPQQRDVAVHIEAASLGGRPSWLRVIPPWTAASAIPATKPATAIFEAAVSVAMVVSLIITSILARRSRRHGRGDLRTASRLAGFEVTALFLFWLLSTHHVLSGVHENSLLIFGLSEAVASAVVIWILYVALEPDVRRRWPQILVGWTRLFAGRFRDPMVGREILFGLLGGVVAVITQIAGTALADRLPPPKAHLLNAPAEAISVLLRDSIEAIGIALGMAFFLLIFRAIVRVEWIAVVLVILMYTVGGLHNPLAVVYVAEVVLLLRLSGLLSAVVMTASVAAVLNHAMTLDTSAWFWPRSIVLLLALAALAAWAARTTIGRKKLLAFEL